MFDLNSAISQWRRAMGDEPGIQNGDLDELEDHLREEIEVLKTSGLNEEEAFLIAARRLGKPEDLSGEFAIADPRRRRSFRLSWMMTGALALVFLWLAVETLTNVGTVVLTRLPGGLGLTHGPMGIGWMAAAIKLGLLMLGVWLIWRLLATDRSSQRLRSLSGVKVIAASVLVAFLVLATRMGSQAFLVRGLPRDTFVDVAVTGAYIKMFLLLALPVILLVGLWRLVKS